ncbi:helix-turn-helix domain-containing protein [Comamonas odontotermitis]|uniref:helix-turn-helix domain-containing protein n=1 Tax=Comamonas odontotermitis TaxID=379895 RepID=UPI001CC3B36B|nr:AraC family transcriptional regulator [Comamonas odontotermitis]UBB15747.1 AraC family transcriptional regulator [Comamonas odontotermitis]
MPSSSHHRIHRHPAAPWAELRISVNTRNCYRPHAHAEYSVGIVDDGCATFYHPSGPNSVKARSVVLIEPNVVHSCNPLHGHIWSYRMMFIEAAWLHHAVARIWGLATPPDDLELMSRCVQDPDMTLLVDQLCQPVASEAAANALTMDLPAWIASLTRAGRPTDCAHAPSDLAPAMAIMQTQSGGRITVKELADVCAMSSSQFIRRFQAALGMTPGCYLQNLRINGARQLLSQGMPLAEAAHTMGFADQAHMQRAFKAHHAMTPGDYRNVSSRVPKVHNN